MKTEPASGNSENRSMPGSLDLALPIVVPVARFFQESLSLGSGGLICYFGRLSHSYLLFTFIFTFITCPFYCIYVRMLISCG